MAKIVEPLGERMRRTREALGLTQKDLADAAGISAAAISQIESGETRTLNAENVFPIARLLKKNPEWLATGAGAEIDYTGIATAISELPDDSPQQTLDFLEYRWQKAEGLIASEKIAHYTKMIEEFKRDLGAREKPAS